VLNVCVGLVWDEIRETARELQELGVIDVWGKFTVDGYYAVKEVYNKLKSRPDLTYFELAHEVMKRVAVFEDDETINKLACVLAFYIIWHNLIKYFELMGDQDELGSM